MKLICFCFWKETEQTSSCYLQFAQSEVFYLYFFFQLTGLCSFMQKSFAVCCSNVIWYRKHPHHFWLLMRLSTLFWGLYQGVSNFGLHLKFHYYNTLVLIHHDQALRKEVCTPKYSNLPEAVGHHFWFCICIYHFFGNLLGQ